MLRSLYRIVPTKYVQDIIKHGLKPTQEFIENCIFMFSIKDLKYWNQSSIFNKLEQKQIPNLLEALIGQASSGMKHKELSLLKINIRPLDLRKMLIREQKTLLLDDHAVQTFKNNLKIDPKIFDEYVKDFMQRTNYSREKAESVVRKAYPDLMLSTYAQEGESFARAKIHTNNKKAIEYIYQEEIPPEYVSVMGSSNIEGKNLVDIWKELTKGSPEANHIAYLT